MFICNHRHFYIQKNVDKRSLGIVTPVVQKMNQLIRIFVLIPIMCILPNELDV